MEILKSIHLFSNLSKRELKEIELSLIEKVYDKGNIIFSNYDKANGMFILTEGKVKLYKSHKGKEQTLRIFTPISMFGEAGAFKGENYPATAVALEKSKILFLPTSNFLKIVKKNPEIAIKMLGVLSERLFHLVNLVENLTLKDAISKVYEYIEKKVNNNNEMEFKTTMAAMELGLTVETVSRAISTLKKRKVIEKNGKIIKLLKTL